MLEVWSSEILIQREGLLSSIHHVGLLVLSDSFLEEVRLSLQRDVLHEWKRIRGIPVLKHKYMCIIPAPSKRLLMIGYLALKDSYIQHVIGRWVLLFYSNHSGLYRY